jgi:SAM-dependent methyltransferase
MARARWPYALAGDLSPEETNQISEEADRLAAASQYGWGQTVDFGPFRKEGLLGDEHLRIAGGLDQWGWWPECFEGMRVADIGCFSGALALLMAHRQADLVYAVDEIPQHLAQCAFLVKTFHVSTVCLIEESAFELQGHIAPGSLDMILLSGVLYHMSDMLVGLHAMRNLLKPGGQLIIQSYAVDDFEHSYANFGRFVAGRWWQPTALCITDMLDFMGYLDPDLRFYEPQYCLARARRAPHEIRFKRGLNWHFEDRSDAVPRSLATELMAPVPHEVAGDTTPLPTR